MVEEITEVIRRIICDCKEGELEKDRSTKEFFVTPKSNWYTRRISCQTYYCFSCGRIYVRKCVHNVAYGDSSWNQGSFILKYKPKSKLKVIPNKRALNKIIKEEEKRLSKSAKEARRKFRSYEKKK